MKVTFSQFAQEVTARFNLQPVDVYFLDLIPLIEMMWADGEVQDTEIEVLMAFVDDLMSRIEQVDDDHSIQKDDVIRFVERYTNAPPDPKLLAELREAAIKIAKQRTDISGKTDILTYCVDIAAASVTENPHNKTERVTETEKALLIKIIAALDIAETTQIDLE